MHVDASVGPAAAARVARRALAPHAPLKKEASIFAARVKPRALPAMVPEPHGDLPDAGVLAAPNLKQPVRRRLHHDVAEEAGVLPTTAWQDIVPVRSCLQELQENPGIRAAVPCVLELTRTVLREKTRLLLEADLQRRTEGDGASAGLPAGMDADSVVAILAYTHDFDYGQGEGNLYFELNNALRQRTSAGRAKMMQTWGVYVHYMLRGLRCFEAWQGTAFRGYPDLAQVRREYLAGRVIQWGGFSSTSTDVDVARTFTDRERGCIFDIAVSEGYGICACSLLPHEEEILLTPDDRFTVLHEVQIDDFGFAVVELVQMTRTAVVWEDL